MAYPDTEHNRRDPVARDPAGTDPRAESNWALIVGIVLAALVALAVISSMGPTDNSATNTPAAPPASTDTPSKAPTDTPSTAPTPAPAEKTPPATTP